MRPATNPFAVRQYGHAEALTPRVMLWRNIVNSTVFVGSRGIAVVDTQVNQSLARRLLAHIRQVFPGKPLLYAINTHYHWDHTNGNAVFKAAGATLVASKRTAVAMVERSPRQKGFLSSRGFDLGPDPLLPDVFVDDIGHIDVGDLRLEMSLGLAAETTDATLIWAPQEQVLVTGDTVMTGSFPIFGQPSQREGLEDDSWLAALAEIRGFKALHIAPGHGPEAGTDELALFERICRYFLVEVRKHHAAGHGLDETIRAMEDDMPAWISRIAEIWGTPRYAILRVWAGLEDLGEPGWQHRKPSAIPRSPHAVAAATTQAMEIGRWSELVAQANEGGDPGLAVSLAEAATAACVDDPAAWTLLATTLIAASRSVGSVLEKGDCFDAARQAIARALMLRPAYGPALLQLGQFHTMMAYRNGDDPTHGEELLEAALADPGLSARQRAEVAFYRGIAARTRGDESGARSAFQQALASDPSYRPAMMAQMA